MNNYLDLNFFQALQDMFAEKFGIASVITDINGIPLTKPSNFTNFCMDCVRGSELGLKKCQFFDAYGGCKAKIEKKPVIYPCHAGLIDFASPIIMDNQLVGCFLCGQILTEAPDENEFRKYARTLGIDEEKYIEELKKVKIISYEEVEYIANFLYKISSKMSKYVYYQNIGLTIDEFYKNSINEFQNYLNDLNLKDENISKNKSFFKKLYKTFSFNKSIDKRKIKNIDTLSNSILNDTSKLLKDVENKFKNFNI